MFKVLNYIKYTTILKHLLTLTNTSEVLKIYIIER